MVEVSRPAVSRRHVIGGGAALAAGTALGGFAAAPANAGPTRGPALRGPQVTLVAAGRPVAAIIVEESNNPMLDEAAHVLQRIVARASGVTLRVLGATDSVSEPAAVRLGVKPRGVV